jgi:hypothetical protein
MRRLDLYFLLLATTALLAGVCMGIAMGVAHDFQFAPVHAHLNLLGWTSLALFGLAYRVYPALSASWLAVVHFALACVGAILFPVGIALSIMEVTVAVAIAAAFVWLAGVVMFLINLSRIIFVESRPLSLAPAE